MTRRDYRQHPAFETSADKHRAAFREDCERLADENAARRLVLNGRRILPAIHSEA